MNLLFRSVLHKQIVRELPSGMVPTMLYALAFAGGIAAHQLYFKHEDYNHHMKGIHYVQFLILAFALAPLKISFDDNGSSGLQPHVRYILESARWAAIAVFVSGIYSSMLVYRALFHPLNKFPGAFMARLTDLWYSSQLKNRDAHHKLLKLHEHYGEFLRIGSSSLSITHPDAVQALYGSGSKCSKGPYYDSGQPYISMQTSRSRRLHDQRRRIWAPAFSDKALRGYEQRIRPYIDLLTSQLRAFGSKPVNAIDWFNFFTFDVMGDLAFNESFHMLERGEEHDILKLLSSSLDFIGVWFPEWLKRMLIIVPGALNDYWKFFKFCSDQITKRMKEDPHIPDIMSSLLAPYQKSDPPVGAEMRYLESDSRLIIVAGSDTTAAALAFLFYNLCKQPEYMAKLRQEFEPYVDAEGNAQNADLQNLALLNAVMTEALRLHPPVPTAIQRLTPPEGITIGEHHIPGNMKVWSPQYVVSRNEDIYKHAYEFIPERWFSKPELVSNDGKSWAPFSLGPMGCIGKPLGLMEMRLAVAKILTNFDVAFAPGETGEELCYRSREHFTLTLKPMMLTFKKRKA